MYGKDYNSIDDNYTSAGKSWTVDVHRTVHKATIRPGSAFLPIFPPASNLVLDDSIEGIVPLLEVAEYGPYDKIMDLQALICR